MCSIASYFTGPSQKYPRHITTENATTGATVDGIEGGFQADLNDVTNKLALTSNKDIERLNMCFNTLV